MEAIRAEELPATDREEIIVSTDQSINQNQPLTKTQQNKTYKNMLIRFFKYLAIIVILSLVFSALFSTFVDSPSKNAKGEALKQLKKEREVKPDEQTWSKQQQVKSTNPKLPNQELLPKQGAKPQEKSLPTATTVKQTKQEVSKEKAQINPNTETSLTPPIVIPKPTKAKPQTSNRPAVPEAKPPVQPTFKTQAQRIKYALTKFNPWDLSNQQKKELLKKYEHLPIKNLQNTTFMPIVQNYSAQILPYLQQFEKTSKVINFEELTMTEEQRKNYSEAYEKKLANRLINKERDLNQQKDFQRNPKDMFISASSITRGKWYEFFLFKTLAGVDINKNEKAKSIAEREKKNFQAAYNISKYKEIRSCIVVPSYQNEANDRFMWNLESILQQDYTNYRVIIVDDASTDKTSELIARHLKWRNATQDKVVLVRSQKHYTAMMNTFYATQKYCGFGQIQYVIDGDDEIIGRQVFKVVNAVYQQEKVLTLYSSHIIAAGNYQSPYHYLGISKPYWQSDIDSNNFRKSRNRGYHHMRTMMSDTFLLMKTESFRDAKGEFYWTIADNAQYFPAMEMSCRLVRYLPQIFYLYNYNTGLQDDFTPKKAEYNKVFQHINNQKSYRCLAVQFWEISQAV